MLIVVTRTGQLGNRISVFARFIAFAIENNVAVVNPSFCEYADFFQSTSEDFFCRYPSQTSSFKGNKNLRTAFYYFIRLLAESGAVVGSRTLKLKDQEEFYLDDPKFLASIDRRQLLFAKGYLVGTRFIDESNFIKHADKVKAYFVPIEKHKRNINILIDDLRKNCEILIGIHIRHGDFKTYKGGKFFYDVNSYIDYMEKMNNIFSDKRVAYLICSDDNQDKKLFSKFNFNFSSGHIIEDLYSLAQCDYIIGSPSSYSTWASFYGNVPYFRIVSPDADISLNSFKIHRVPIIWY